MRFAYADPPYIGQAKRYEGGVEVNHRILIGYLDAHFDGWALSCSVPSLFEILALVPWTQGRTRILSWCKPYAPHRPGVWPTYAWEPVVCRLLDRPASRTRWTPMDWFSCEVGGKGRPGIGKQRILGEKPAAFVHWVLNACKVRPDDDVEDVFPGSGAVTEAIEMWRRQATLPLAVGEGG